MAQSGHERREQIIEVLKNSTEPVAGTELAKQLHVSRQVILNLFVDLGAKVENVFVFHKVYNVIKANMNIKSRRDVSKYMEGITSGKSTNLMNLTSNYHYHTIIEYDEVYDLNDYYDLDNSFSIAPHRKMRCGAFFVFFL